MYYSSQNVEILQSPSLQFMTQNNLDFIQFHPVTLIACLSYIICVSKSCRKRKRGKMQVAIKGNSPFWRVLQVLEKLSPPPDMLAIGILSSYLKTYPNREKLLSYPVLSTLKDVDSLIMLSPEKADNWKCSQQFFYDSMKNNLSWSNLKFKID